MYAVNQTESIQGLKTAFARCSYKCPPILNPLIVTSKSSTTLPEQEYGFLYFASSHKVIFVPDTQGKEDNSIFLSLNSCVLTKIRSYFTYIYIFLYKDLGVNWRPGGNWIKLENFCHSHSHQLDVNLRRKYWPSTYA